MSEPVLQQSSADAGSGSARRHWQPSWGAEEGLACRSRLGEKPVIEIFADSSTKAAMDQGHIVGSGLAKSMLATPHAPPLAAAAAALKTG